MKVLISRNELQAALLFAGSDETRYVLTGVLIESKPNKQPIMIATNGRLLCVIESLSDQSEVKSDDLPDQILLHPGFIKALCGLSKAIGGKSSPQLLLTHEAGSKALSASIHGKSCITQVDDGALLDATYPNWRDVIPPKRERVGATELGINAEYVGCFSKAAELIGAKDVAVQFALTDRDSIIEVIIPSARNFYGVIMPFKIDPKENYQPSFICK